jgi:hypothetical protein
MKKWILSIVRIRSLKNLLKILQNIGMKNIEAREPSSIAEAETYLSHFGEKKHSRINNRMDWKGTEKKISLMDWSPIQISEIALYLLKAQK